MKTKEQIIEAMYSAIPYSNQIKNLQILEDQVRFEWRKETFRVTLNADVEEVGEGVLIGSNAAILIRTLLEKYFISKALS